MDGRGDTALGSPARPGSERALLRALSPARCAGEEHTVGVLAVDPSSKRSGGALLGDRARIETHPDDEGLFVRSLATAGELGGLARAAPAAVMILAAAFDRVIVETVGVGQSETDVEYVVDTVVLVVQPGSGDTLQFLKAGIVEIPTSSWSTRATSASPPRGRKPSCSRFCAWARASRRRSAPDTRRWFSRARHAARASTKSSAQSSGTVGHKRTLAPSSSAACEARSNGAFASSFGASAKKASSAREDA